MRFLGTVQSQSGGALILARNDGGNRFFDIAGGTLGGGQDGAFSGSFADYDGDGDAGHLRDPTSWIREGCSGTTATRASRM